MIFGVSSKQDNCKRIHSSLIDENPNNSYPPNIFSFKLDQFTNESNVYRVFRGFRLNRGERSMMIIFRPFLTTFEVSFIFKAVGGSNKNWLKP